MLPFSTCVEWENQEFFPPVERVSKGSVPNYKHSPLSFTRSSFAFAGFPSQVGRQPAPGHNSSGGSHCLLYFIESREWIRSCGHPPPRISTRNPEVSAEGCCLIQSLRVSFGPLRRTAPLVLSSTREATLSSATTQPKPWTGIPPIRQQVFRRIGDWKLLQIHRQQNEIVLLWIRARIAP